jgi:sugar transferase (PEP-CTERM/EpsH1 system associated)
MRILFLSHRMPFPPNKGDKIRAFNILKYLSARHEVSLATLIDDAADLARIDELRNHVARLQYARVDQPGRKFSSVLAMASGRSITVRHFYSSAVQGQVDDLVESGNIDAVYCSSSPMAEYVFRSRSGRMATLPRVMDLIDVDSYKWKQYASLAPFWKSWVYRYEYRVLAAFERRIYREFDHVVLISEAEKGYFPCPDESGRLNVVSNGVDLEYFTPDFAANAVVSEAPSIVFTGVMDYRPNIDGMKWFIDEVLSLVRAEIPNSKLFVVGARPAPAVLDWSRLPGVTVTGFVEDVRDYLSAADVCIAPLKLARGVQNKVLEAMAMGRPVVATPEAFEGIDAEAGRDILTGATAAEFAAAVVGLLRDPERADRIGKAARKSVAERYAWADNLAVLGEMFSKAPVHDAGSQKGGVSV